jgi:hypothetical protein
MTKRVFLNYYFRTKYGQGAKAAAYFEEIKAEALKLGIVEVRMGLVEIGDYSPSTCFSLTLPPRMKDGLRCGTVLLPNRVKSSSE